MMRYFMFETVCEDWACPEEHVLVVVRNPELTMNEIEDAVTSFAADSFYSMFEEEYLEDDMSQEEAMASAYVIEEYFAYSAALEAKSCYSADELDI